jgi:hypothetical protein
MRPPVCPAWARAFVRPIVSTLRAAAVLGGGGEQQRVAQRQRPRASRSVVVATGRHRGWPAGGGRERTRPSVDAIGYLSDAQQMDVTEQGETELVVRISKGTVTLNNRPRAGGSRYDAVRARCTALASMLRPRSLLAAPTGR